MLGIDDNSLQSCSMSSGTTGQSCRLLCLTASQLCCFNMSHPCFVLESSPRTYAQVLEKIAIQICFVVSKIEYIPSTINFLTCQFFPSVSSDPVNSILGFPYLKQVYKCSLLPFLPNFPDLHTWTGSVTQNTNAREPASCQN